VGFHGAIGSRDGDASQDEASRNLVYVEKSLIVLIDAAADQPACAGRTETRPAGHRQVDLLVGGGIKDRLVIGAFDRKRNRCSAACRDTARLA
jgi:hypothetical protein